MQNMMFQLQIYCVNLNGKRWKSAEVTNKHKVKKWTAPDPIKNLFNVCDNQNYSLRSNLNNFKLGKPKRNFMKKSINYSGAKFWNDLKNCLKSETTSYKILGAIVGDV